MGHTLSPGCPTVFLAVSGGNKQWGAGIENHLQACTQYQLLDGETKILFLIKLRTGYIVGF